VVTEPLLPYVRTSTTHAYHEVLVERFGNDEQRRDKLRYTHPPFPEHSFMILNPERFRRTCLMAAYKLVEPVRLELVTESVNLLCYGSHKIVFKKEEEIMAEEVVPTITAENLRTASIN
jgi:hypothetical protein